MTISPMDWMLSPEVMRENDLPAGLKNNQHRKDPIIMFAQGQHQPIGFGISLTPTGKAMLIAYAAVYVLELLAEHWMGIPLYQWLALSPPGSGYFQFWQLVTHPLVHDPSAPIGFLIDCLVFYFFAGTIELSLGTAGFLRLYLMAAVGAAIGGLAFSVLFGVGIPYAGMMPSLLGLIVVFGLLQPETTVLLMFVLPVKAKYISYGTVVVTALTFLARTNPHGAYHLGGIGLAWLTFRSPSQWLDMNWWRWKYFEYKQKQHRAKFTVIKGKKNDDDDRPTIH
ncbi:rhomboid family intramembrane serine protease [Desulfosarcina ovata]|nr:rhomboid family intramembrane serine protease [Desulfosarcina ovata]